MPHGNYVDKQILIDDGVNDTVIADSDAPQNVRTLQFAASGGPGRSGRCLDFENIFGTKEAGSDSSSFRADREKEIE